MQPPDDPLDALLQENDTYVEDAGFTARVVASLAPRRRSRLRPAILCGAIFVGLALLIGWLPSFKDEFFAVTNDGIVFDLNFQSGVLLVVMFAALATIAWGVFSVVRSED